MHDPGPKIGADMPTRRKFGGRPKGAPTKTTAETGKAARLHGPACIAQLARLAFHWPSEAIQVAAIKELLDRGYGKATQAHAGDGQEGPVSVIVSWRPVDGIGADPLVALPPPDPLAGLPRPRRRYD